MPILFCNVGWMEKYQGLHAGDSIEGGGSFVAKEGRGHEICNFASVEGKYFGYVQPSGAQIEIGRLGAGQSDKSIGGVTVVWTATRPKSVGGGTAIVGWYRDATVYRSYQKHRPVPDVQRANKIDGYWVEAPTKESRLIKDLDARVFDIPRGVKGGMGQSNVWYADAAEAASLVKKVNAYLNAGESAHLPRPAGKARKQDQERKARIERAAVDACWVHYENLGYAVRSVERDNTGWDLEATSGRITLRVEVKGLSGPDFSIELTPNEYAAFSQAAEDYRLAVVVETLTQPKLSICRYSAERAQWLVEGEETRELEVLVRQGAVVKCA